MGLPEPSPGVPPRLMLPAPEEAASAVSSWTVATTASFEDERPVVTVRRHPAAVSGAEHETPQAFTHLACDDHERDRRLVESASVLIRRHALPTSVAALRWIGESLRRCPGCRLAAVALDGGGCLVGLRDGRVVEAAVTGPAADPGLPAATVYTLLRAGAALDDVMVTLRTGELREEDVSLRLRPRTSADPFR